MKLGLGFRVCGFKIGGDGGEMVESFGWRDFQLTSDGLPSTTPDAEHLRAYRDFRV